MLLIGRAVFVSAVVALALLPKLVGDASLIPSIGLTSASAVPLWSDVALVSAAVLGMLCFGLVRLATRPGGAL
jgi:hypothetical protein